MACVVIYLIFLPEVGGSCQQVLECVVNGCGPVLAIEPSLSVAPNNGPHNATLHTNTHIYICVYTSLFINSN